MSVWRTPRGAAATARRGNYLDPAIAGIDDRCDLDLCEPGSELDRVSILDTEALMRDSEINWRVRRGLWRVDGGPMPQSLPLALNCQVLNYQVLTARS